MVKNLNLLLIEDNEIESKALTEYVDTTDDMKIVAITNSARKGIEYVKNVLPDVIILDLELHAGEGNGVTFLKTLNQLELSHYPYILVTTNNINPITLAKVRKSGAGFIMTKNQEDYSAGNVIEFIREMKDSIKSNNSTNRPCFNLSTIETLDEFSKRIARLINKELDLVGLSPKMKGRAYLKEGIQILVHNISNESICSLISRKYEKTDASVERAMQHVINKSWRTMPIEDLTRYYTAYINPQRGVPTNTEFMFYYAEKIKNKL